MPVAEINKDFQLKIKALVVDDTIFYRKIISEILASFPFVEVVGTANNGEIAMSRIRLLKPDLLTLDVEMPVMNGLSVLQEIRRQNLPIDCLMLSSKTLQGCEITMQALELGAFDFITKPDDISPRANLQMLTRELRRKLTIFHERLKMLDHRRNKPLGCPSSSKRPAGRVAIAEPAAAGKRKEKSHAVAIGISTGGPYALGRVLPSFPADLGVPIFLVQHMPPLFTESLANSLNNKCRLTVKEAVDGEQVRKNHVYVAPGGKQMKVASGLDHTKLIRITDAPPENNCRPSVDYLFRSVAREYGSKATCVVMTGMGTDGKSGLAVARASGAVNIAQNEETCVVYGMPKAAIDSGLINIVAPLEKIAEAILKTV
ncbi:MAG: chemotaxis response regulator protein-glutamate methylesterase [Desulfobulbaceae bacterium]|nr:chemotaxis response regulator protein-glutamate methylesterase [Desulfobulbaceae bacterium]